MFRSNALLLGLAISLTMVTGLAEAIEGEIRTGDGVGLVRSYDAIGKAVLIGEFTVPLAPQAEVSLQRQLAYGGWVAGRPFGARYSVRRDTSGRPTITTIHVFLAPAR